MTSTPSSESLTASRPNVTDGMRMLMLCVLRLHRDCIFLSLLKRSGLSADDLLCFYRPKSVIRSVLEYGSLYGIITLHMHAQHDKLEALQKHAVRIILYPISIILPYITALGYLKLESLKHRRTVADKKFFNGISQSYNCLHHLLPPPCPWYWTRNEIAARKQVSHTFY